MDAPSTAPYPGFDSSGQYCTPRRPPRVRSEAQEFANKNAGSINLFSDEKNTHHVQGPPPSPRCLSQAAKENYARGRNGLVSGLLGGGGPMPAPEPVCAARVKPEAQGTAELHKGGNMSQLITLDSSRPASARGAPRVKVEASENAELDRGQRMNTLMHDAKAMPETPKPVPRVKEDARETAKLGAGSQMAKNMFEYGKTPRSTRMAPRVKREASENAELDQGKRMQTLFDYNKPKSARAPPPVRQSMMSRLMHEGDSMHADPRKMIRAASASGRRITRKNQQGSISQVFAETSKWQIVPSAGVRGKAC